MASWMRTAATALSTPPDRAADDAALADLLLDLGDHLAPIGGHGPIGLQAGNLVHEVGEQLGAVRRMHDLRMELNGVEAARFIRNDGEGRVLARCDDGETGRQLRDAVAVAHPDLMVLADLPNAFIKRARLLDRQHGAAELAMMAALDLAAELLGHGLLAVADAENGDAGFEDGLRRPRAFQLGDGGRTA